MPWRRSVRSGGTAEEEGFTRLVYAEALHASGRHELAQPAIAVARDGLLATAAKISNLLHRASFLEFRERAHTRTRARVAWCAITSIAR